MKVCIFYDVITGRKHKHMHKRCHFESVVPLEPVVLEKKFARLELEDEPHKHSTKQCSTVLAPTFRRDNNNNIEENARDLLNLVKRSIAPNVLITKAENLLFDFFKKSIEENKDIDYSKKWKNSYQEIQQLGQELANEVFTNLVNEFIFELTTRAS